MQFISFIFLLFLLGNLNSQDFELTKVETNQPSNHYRGLHVVNDSVIWISGTNGSFLTSSNNGKSWYGDTIKHKVDFRDIHAFNDHEAIMISSEMDHVYIVKTVNGGKDWFVAYEDPNKGTFFNGLNFIDKNIGFAYGDPIDGKINLLKTSDGGNTWSSISSNLPVSIKGEAGFAASGSGIQIHDNHIIIAQGSADTCRVLISEDQGETWEYINTPMISGEGKGIYGLDFIDKNDGIAVGGFWESVNDSINNCILTHDGGKTWYLSHSFPKGYRSGVSFHSKDVVFCSGRNGTDISYDGGANWQRFSELPFYSIESFKQNTWFTGSNGKVYHLTW